MKTKLRSSRLMSIISLLILCLYANSAWATNVSKADIDGAIGINVATQKMDVSGSIADKMPIPVGDVHKLMTADLMFGKQALKTNLQQTGGKTRSISLDGKVATPRKAPTKTAVNVSGLIDASTLADNAEIVLTGNTNLFMNVNKTLKCISGDYTLTISGGNILTINNPNGAGIEVKSLNSTAPLNITARDNAIATTNAVGDVTINGNLTAETTGDKYFCIVGKKVTLIGGTMKITSVTNAVVSYGDMILGGDITASATDDHSGAFNTRDGGNLLIQEGSTINALSAGFGIYAAGNITMPNGSLTARGYSNATVQCNSGNISLTGTINVKGKDCAICAGDKKDVGDVTINGDLTAETTGNKYYCIVGKKVTLIGGTMTITSVTNAVVSYGDMILGGDITASATDDHSGAFNTRDGGNLLIQEGSTINALSAGFGIYAAGNITMPNGSLTARGYSNATVQCNSGNISLTGTINVKGKDCAICAGDEKDVGDVTINGDLTAETTGNKYYCIVGKKVTLIGGTMTITSVTNAVVSYGDMILGGDITASATDDHSGAFNTRDGGNLLIQEGSTINALSAGFGIYAAGNITMPNGSLTARGYSNATVQCNSGNISLTGTINVKGKDCAICAGDENVVGDVTINGDLTAETTGDKYFCIVGKKVTLIGGTMKITSVTNAVVSYGDITLSGEITAVSSMKNSVAINSRDDGNIIVKNGKIIAKGGDIGIYATGSINLTPPLVVITAAGGGISDDGHTVVYDNGKVATRVVIMDPPIAGVVSLNSAPTPGNAVGFTLSGEIASAQTENTWQISNDDVTWQDIVESPAGAPALDSVHQQRRAVTTLTYTPKESEMGKYLRVKVAAVGHTGYIYSPSRQIAKKICTDVPVVPTLTNINDKVHLSNAKTTQEYIIFNYSKEASSLTANDWSNAVTPESEVGFFEMNSTPNANHTVFTRIKETTSTLASENVAEARLYIGTSVYLQDIELNITKTVGYFQKINNELNCKVGDVIRCDASPVPSDATNWYGISGSNWTVDYRNTGSPYGTFYEDADCTRPISSSSNYTTVYLKTLATKNYLDVRIQAYNSAIGYKTRYVQFNVTPDGYFPLLDYITNCSMTIAVGEKITGIEVERRPFSGSVYGLTTEVSGEGSAPIVRFDMYEKMNIDATNATPGVYTYTPIQDGNPLTSTFTITVTDGHYDVDSVLMREKYIVADPGERVELVAQLMPANSEAEIQWTSSNTSVATVTDGIVTIADNAAIGAAATITASANGKSDECKITVSGEEYGLYVASTQVTSRNRDDILGDGKFSFDGLRTLTINGDYTVSNSSNFVRNTGIDGLYINIAQACTISQGEESYSTLFDLRKNTAIHGEQMTVNGNGIAFSTQGGMTLTLDSANLVVSAIMPFKGSGIDEDNMNIMNSHVEVNASGSAAIFSFAGGISLTDCHIQIPTNAVVTNGTIEDGNGSQVRNLLIVPNPVKTEPALAFAASEATAIVGETFTAPILSNPNNLTITYYSEDPMIAKVDAQTGEVTPMAAGTTIITAYTDGNLYHKAGEVFYTLTVLKGSVSLSFSQPTASVNLDATEFVLPTLSNPQDVSVTYSSSNPAVATVLALTGDVTLLAVGTTTITATFDGDGRYNGASASYMLTVNPNNPTGVDNIYTSSESARKVMIDNQIFIIRDGKMYTITGYKVK